MRFQILIVAVALGLASPASAQWTTTCVRYTARIRTCSARYAPAPTPPRHPVAAPAPMVGAPAGAELLDDEQDTVLGTWRATGVVFESHGERTLLEARVTGTPGGIHIVVPAALRFSWSALDLARVAPMIYRGTDRARSIVTFSVAGGRAELAVTGADGAGLVTYQFDAHEGPR